VEKSKILLTAFLVVALTGFLAGSAVAQNPVGKIAGKVIDKNTKQPLIRVNVVVQGMQGYGAATDEKGEYIILNLPPGEYDLTASMIGYNKMTVQKVRVVVDLTTPLNFELSEEALDIGGEVVVTADRELIQRDKTSKVSTITQEEIVDMPVVDLVSILATQSNITILSGTPYAKRGYESRGLDDIRMRGGRNNEVALLIDGMAVSNPLFGGFATRVNNMAIGQMSIAAGGFDASYGNSLSGVVNLSTREGGNRYSGQIQYNSSRPFGIDAITPTEGEARNHQNIEGSLSGPVPGVRGLSFFVSGDILVSAGNTVEMDQVIWDDHRDSDGDGIPDLPTSLEILKAYAKDGTLLVDRDQARQVTTDVMIGGRKGRWINPLDMYKGWQGIGFTNSAALTSKLTYRMTNMRLSVSFNHSQRYTQTPARDSFWYYYWPVGRYVWTPPNDVNRTYKYKDTIYQIQPEPFYSYYLASVNNPNSQFAPGNEFDYLTNYTYNTSGIASRQPNFRHSQRYAVSWTHNISPSTFYSFNTQMFHQQRKTRVIRDYSKRFKSSWNIFGPDWNNIKTKYEYDWSAYNSYDPWESNFQYQGDSSYYEGDESFNYTGRLDFTSQVTKNHQVKTGFEFRYIDLLREDYQSGGELDANPTIYRMFPKEGAVYLTDKIEFSNIIFNLGLRLDYANAGGSMWTDPLDPLGTQDPQRAGLEYNGWVTAKRKFKVSPRIGIAFPLTDESVVHFNFGHFYQNSNYRDLYRSLGEFRELALVQGGNAIIGNPSLEPEKSIQYELGLQQQLGQYFALNVSLWLKETTNQVGSVRVNSYSDPGYDNPYTYSVFLNNNFGSAKGVDLTLIKRYSHYFSGNVNYTWSKAMVLMQTSWDGYWDGVSANTMPKRERVADWDQPHSIRGQVAVNLPRDFGPEAFGFKPFSLFGFNLIYYGESGRVYTPSTQSGAIREANSGRWPFVHRIDGRFRKTFRLFDLETQAFVNVTNLFDTRNALTGYTVSGRPDIPASGANMSATSMNASIANNFQRGRGVDFGFRIRW